MLAKESIGLPDIIRILGDRPFPMKETVREYLQEMMERKEKEDSEKVTTASEEEKKETFREAKILEVLNHPNIIRFKEVYKTKKGQLCIVMDYADGTWRSFLTQVIPFRR